MGFFHGAVQYAKSHCALDLSCGNLAFESKSAMAKVTFTANLMRHVDCPSVDAFGATVREVLAAVFAENPRLKSYVVDEQFSLRRHMGIIVDGEIVMDRKRLSDPVESNSEVFVLQALSGG
jgi:sulfur-carrier protein